MHIEIANFLNNVKHLHPQYFNNVKVLEVGSQNINGSIRPIIENCDYTGIDLGEAVGVDVVADINDCIHPNIFDTVVSCEMLEHCEHWEKALLSMYINTKPNGIFILTCASTTRPEHGTHAHSSQDSKFTLNHYRNITIKDFMTVLPEELFHHYCIGVYRDGQDLYFWGIKK